MRLELKYMTGIALALCATCPSLGALAGRAQAGSESQPQLTADELQRLAGGEMVERRLVREQGDRRLMGGTSWQVIDAQPEVVWQALLDTPYYPRMLPQVSEARLVSETDTKRTVFVRHGGGLTQTSYYLDVQIDRLRHDMSFRIDASRPHGIRAAWGFYAVRAYAEGKTLLAYGVMADIGNGLGSMLLRGSVHEWMMKVPWMVKRFVEGSGRYLYGRQKPAAAPSPAAVAVR
jgi:hypothetical protein